MAKTFYEKIAEFDYWAHFEFTPEYYAGLYTNYSMWGDQCGHVISFFYAQEIAEHFRLRDREETC